MSIGVRLTRRSIAIRVALLAQLSIVGLAAVPAATPPLQGQLELSQASGDSLRHVIDRALISNADRDYDRALSWLDSELTRRPTDAVLLHYRGFVLYRKASQLLSTVKNDKGAKTLFEQADRALEQSAAGLAWPETLALRSAVTGQLIGFGGALTGMRLGPRAARLLDEAMAMGPENPRVWMLRGVSELYKPRLMGGGADKAARSLERALTLFPSDAPVAPAPWWGYAETYGWLGQMYAKQGKTEQARAAYARALQLQPGNSWVSDLLLPSLDRPAR